MMQDTASLIEALEARILTAPPAECPALVGTMERLKALAWGRMTTHAVSVTASTPADSVRYLTVEETAQRFHVTPKWLYRHKAQMPHSQPSRKVLLFPEAAVTKWFASRKQ